MAEAVLRQRWRQSGFDDLVVSSMGTHGLDRKPASRLAIDVCKGNGIDLTGHLSRHLIPTELRESDLVLCMEAVQRDFTRVFFPSLSDKCFLLGAWPGEETRKSNIRDPIGGSLRVYRQVYTTIAGHIDRILPALRENCL